MDGAVELLPLHVDRPPVGTLSIALRGHVLAFVRLGMHCGALCGQGWTYRLVREGRRWRVVVGTFDWVS
jgi:hypothetical protein